MTLAEHSPAGSPVITVTATDKDTAENGRISYRVMSSTRDIFYIDPNNGGQTILAVWVLYSQTLLYMNTVIECIVINQMYVLWQGHCSSTREQSSTLSVHPSLL